MIYSILSFWILIFTLSYSESFLFELVKSKLSFDCSKPDGANLLIKETVNGIDSQSKTIESSHFFPFVDNSMNPIISSIKTCHDNVEKGEIDFFKLKLLLNRIEMGRFYHHDDNYYKLNHGLTEINEALHNYIINGKHEITKPIIKISSSLLPAMDGIAHHVLTLNQNFIHFVLDYDKIPDEIKKECVLFSISAAQNGDNMGSAILEFYYNLVDRLM